MFSECSEHRVFSECLEHRVFSECSEHRVFSECSEHRVFSECSVSVQNTECSVSVQNKECSVSAQNTECSVSVQNRKCSVSASDKQQQGYKTMIALCDVFRVPARIEMVLTAGTRCACNVLYSCATQVHSAHEVNQSDLLPVSPPPHTATGAAISSGKS